MKALIDFLILFPTVLLLGYGLACLLSWLNKPSRHSKYRLVKTTKVSGFVLWSIYRRSSWLSRFFGIPWEFVDCWSDEDKAREVLDRLVKGRQPEETKEVIYEQT